MKDNLDTIRNLVANKIVQIRAEYYDISKKIRPIQKKMAALQEQVGPLIEKSSHLKESIKNIEQSLSLKEGTILTIIKLDESGDKAEMSRPLTGKKPKQAYRQAIKTDFRDESFTGVEIREYVRRQGLKISNTYSRVIMSELTQEGLVRRIEPGVFQFNEQEKVVF